MVEEKKYKFHKLTAKYHFPFLDDKELGELAEDIKKNGLNNPITLYEDKILDGRNRYKACLLAGVTPKFVQYTGDNPEAFVLSQNLLRRHLTQIQRADIGLVVEMEVEAKKAKERQKEHAGTAPGKKKTLPPSEGVSDQSKHDNEAIRIAAKIVGVGHDTLRKAKTVKKVAEKSKVVSNLWKKGKTNPQITVAKVYEVAKVIEEIEEVAKESTIVAKILKEKIVDKNNFTIKDVAEVVEIATIPDENLRNLEVIRREGAKKKEKQKRKNNIDISTGIIPPPSKTGVYNRNKVKFEEYKSILHPVVRRISIEGLEGYPIEISDECIKMMDVTSKHLLKELAKTNKVIEDNKKNIIEVEFDD